MSFNDSGFSGYSGYSRILWIFSGTATAALAIFIGAMFCSGRTLGPAHETQGARDSADRRAKCGETICEMQNANGGLVEANNLGNDPVD